jgi:hypothetical protein
VKIAMILVTALSATGMFAQAPAENLGARIQVYGEAIQPRSLSMIGGVSDKAGSSVGVGFRFMGEIASARCWYYEVGGKLDSSSNFKLNDGVNDLTDMKFTHSYWSLGLGYLAPLGSSVSLGFHLEGRGETLSCQGTYFKGPVPSGTVDAGNSFLRPWFRVSLDGSWHMGSLNPYVGVEVAATPVRTTQTVLVTSPSDMDNRTLRSMAPQADAAVYFGLQF